MRASETRRERRERRCLWNESASFHEKKSRRDALAPDVEGAHHSSQRARDRRDHRDLLSRRVVPFFENLRVHDVQHVVSHCDGVEHAFVPARRHEAILVLVESRPARRADALALGNQRHASGNRALLRRLRLR